MERKRDGGERENNNDLLLEDMSVQLPRRADVDTEEEEIPGTAKVAVFTETVVEEGVEVEVEVHAAVDAVGGEVEVDIKSLPIPGDRLWE